MLDPAIRVNEARFWRTVERSGAIGPGRPGGGLSRLALYTAPGVNVLPRAAAARAGVA